MTVPVVGVWLGTATPPSLIVTLLRSYWSVDALVKVTVTRYFLVLPPAHWHTVMELTNAGLPETAKAGAATATATAGTLQAAPRATVRLEI